MSRRRHASTDVRTLLVPSAAGAAVAVGLGVYARVHEPTATAVNVAGFSSFQSVKAWLATVAVALAVVQVLSSLAIYGKLPRVGPAIAIARAHKWSGRAAVAVTLPVAAHCLYALGFQSADLRVLIHSVLGCFLYGAFTTKMLVLARDDTPGWVLPLAGGAVFTGLVGLWLTSSLWFFTTFGVVF